MLTNFNQGSELAPNGPEQREFRKFEAPESVRTLRDFREPCLLLCWFLDAGNKEAPYAQLTGVQKAPRHEIAGSWAPARQRALCGFNVAAALDGKRDASAKRRHVCIPENRRECSGASRRAREVQQRTGC